MTAASNAVGTVPDLAGHRRRRARAPARACTSTPSTPPRTGRIDVAALGCDVLACSAYKWFGPHVGMLCAAPELLEALRPDKLRPSPDEVPDRWELGTLPFESLAGVPRRGRLRARARLGRRSAPTRTRCSARARRPRPRSTA